MTTEIKTDSKGTIRYFKDGQRHRTDGPAVIYKGGAQRWYQHGLIHRADGPAIIWPNGSLEWYITGHSFPFDEWCKQANISDQQKTLLMLKYNTTEAVFDF